MPAPAALATPLRASRPGRADPWGRGRATVPTRTGPNQRAIGASGAPGRRGRRRSAEWQAKGERQVA